MSDPPVDRTADRSILCIFTTVSPAFRAGSSRHFCRFSVFGKLPLRPAPAKARPKTSAWQRMRSTCQRALPAAPAIGFAEDLIRLFCSGLLGVLSNISLSTANCPYALRPLRRVQRLPHGSGCDRRVSGHCPQRPRSALPRTLSACSAPGFWAF